MSIKTKCVAFIAVLGMATACGDEVNKNVPGGSASTPNGETTSNGETTPDEETTYEQIELAPGLVIDLTAAIEVEPPTTCDQVDVLDFPYVIYDLVELGLFRFVYDQFLEENPLGGEIERVLNRNDDLTEVIVDTDSDGEADFRAQFEYTDGFLLRTTVDSDADGTTDFSIESLIPSADKYENNIDANGDGETDVRYTTILDELNRVLVAMDRDGDGENDYTYRFNYGSDGLPSVYDIYIDGDSNNDFSYQYSWMGENLTRVTGDGFGGPFNSFCE